MAQANAYRVLKSVNVPKPLAKLEATDLDGNPMYETQGVLYEEDSYVKREDIVPTLFERLDNGELDEFLEPVSDDEMEAVEAELRAAQFSTFAPEHEVERVTLADYGHRTLSRRQILAMNAAGADNARESLELAKDQGLDERPNITEQPTFQEKPSLAEASREGKTVLATEDTETPDVDVPSAQTMPSGVEGGEVKAGAERSAVRAAQDTVEASKEAVESRSESASKPRQRKRPGQGGGVPEAQQSAKDKKDNE